MAKNDSAATQAAAPAPVATSPAPAASAEPAASAAPAATQAAAQAAPTPPEDEGLTAAKLGAAIDVVMQEGASEDPPLTIASALHQISESGLPDPHGATCGQVAFAINTGLVTSTAKEFFEQSTGDVIAKTIFDLVAQKRATQQQVTAWLRTKHPERRVAPSSSL